jgi:uncharacterized protein YkwD
MFNCPGITKNFHSFVEGDAVFLFIGCGFPLVPFETQPDLQIWKGRYQICTEYIPRASGCCADICTLSAEAVGLRKTLACSYNLDMQALLVALIVLVSLQKADQPQFHVPDLERRVHDLINKERKDKKADNLQFDRQLAEIARVHSADMAKRKFFDHKNPDGKDANARGKAAGYTCRKVYTGYFTDGLAENIYQGSLYSRIRITGNKRSYDWYSLEEMAREIVEGWMDSPGHRRNVLEKTYEKEGIGIFISADDKVYVTQVFC